MTFNLASIYHEDVEVDKESDDYRLRADLSGLLPGPLS
jgi:hypothetical protein